MSIFEKIHVRGFRRLRDVDLKLKPLNVLIGANGSGKTTLLDVFTLLAASAAGKLNETLSDLGGINENLTNLITTEAEKSPFMEFELLTSDDPFPLGYRINLAPQGVTYTTGREILSQQTHAGTRRSLELVSIFSVLDYDSRESALSQAPKNYPVAENFRKRLASSTHYHVLDVSKRAPVRLPQQLRMATLPGRDGEDLVSCLYMLRESEPDSFTAVEDALRAGFPNFERLNFPPVAAGMLAMTWKDATSKHPFYMHQLSEGTLRFLWLVTLLQSPGLTAVTLIDEPEVSLHPELLSLLAELMREASQRTQLIVATHADRLIRYLKPEEVLTTNIDEHGAVNMTWADECDLEQWLDEYTLDEVWRMGRMGGRA